MLLSILSGCLLFVPYEKEDPGQNLEDTTETGDTGEVVPSVLEVSFTSAYHSAAFFSAEPGEEVILGTVTAQSLTEEPIQIDQLDLAMYVMAAPEITDGTGFVFATTSGWSAYRLVDSCRLSGWPELTEFGVGTVSEDGHLLVETDFTVEGEFSTAVDVRCTLATDGFPNGDFGLAFDLKPDEVSVVASANDDITIEVTARNGTYLDGSSIAMVPQVAAVVTIE